MDQYTQQSRKKYNLKLEKLFKWHITVNDIRLEGARKCLEETRFHD